VRRQDPATLAVVSVVTGMGLGIRLAAVIPSPFPLNDGGLFYTMIADLVSNQLKLPAYTTYNTASIPFAYPPLAFYFYAILHIVTHISLLRLMQYGPPIISSLSIPAFYLLAEELLDSKVQAVLSMLVFALLPRAFDWLIMGGGVTRSFGMLFALLAIRQAYRLFGTPAKEAILPMIVTGGLVAYSHPEAATHTALTAVLFYLWKDRTRRGLLSAALVVVGILALTSPWWAAVLRGHGLNPFLAAAAAARQDSYNVFAGLLALFRFDFADEPFVAVLTVLGLVGIVFQLAHRQYLLPVWLLAMHTLEPRGGTLFMMIPLAMCTGVALDKVVLPPLDLPGTAPPFSLKQEIEPGANSLDRLFRGRGARLFLGFLLCYAGVSAFAASWSILHEFTLATPDLQAFAWVRSNTGAQSRFSLVTGELPLRDASSEWFPALTGRISLGTVFGFEWIHDKDFSARVERYESLQACAVQGSDCLEAWSKNHGEPLEYVYIRDAAGISAVPLEAYLSKSPDFEDVYSSQTVAIFRLK